MRYRIVFYLGTLSAGLLLAWYRFNAVVADNQAWRDYWGDNWMPDMASNLLNPGWEAFNVLLGFVFLTMVAELALSHLVASHRALRRDARPILELSKRAVSAVREHVIVPYELNGNRPQWSDERAQEVHGTISDACLSARSLSVLGRSEESRRAARRLSDSLQELGFWLDAPDRLAGIGIRSGNGVSRDPFLRRHGRTIEEALVSVENEIASFPTFRRVRSSQASVSVLATP